MPNPVSKYNYSGEREFTPAVKVKKSLDEILTIFHEMSPEFLGNSYFLYKMAKKLTPEQASKEIPIYLEFLKAQPYETLNKEKFLKGLKKNPAIYDSYLAASLDATADTRPDQLVVLLYSAYTYQIPELVQKVLEHEELLPLDELFQTLFENGTVEQIKATFLRFGKDRINPLMTRILPTLTRNPIEHHRLQEIMDHLQGMGVDIRAYILETPEKSLCSYAGVQHFDYMLSFLSPEEQVKVLDVGFCQLVLNFLLIFDDETTKADFLKKLLDLFKEKQLPLEAILLQKFGKREKKSIFDRAADNKEIVALLERYFETTNKV